ncbi:MAG: acetylglutamate kinase [Gaiellales bacterium]|nr:acetylglutamate kinase [Gaiellales bacterium]
MTTVVKIGGAAAGAAAHVARLAASGTGVVVVHGGGAQISDRCRAAGIEPVFVAGQRVTDTAVLEVVKEALTEVGVELAAAIEAAGTPAQPIGGVVQAERYGHSALGLVGRVTAIDASPIAAVLASGAVPVVSPFAAGFNVNADHAAAAIAKGLGADELVFLSDVPGIVDAAGRVIQSITAAGAEALIGDGQVTGGMVPKVHAGLAALAGGVWRVRIGAETMVTA